MNSAHINLFRLTSGEEIIAECNIGDIAMDERKIRCYEIKNPIIMLPMGQGEIGLAPWIPYCDTGRLMIPETSVLFRSVPQKNLRTSAWEGCISMPTLSPKGIEGSA